MTRRHLLLLPLASRLRADAEEQVYELFTDVASQLANSNSPGFMARFDRSMPGYDELRRNIAGLLVQAEVQSSVEVLKNEGSETARAVELDWFLQIRQRHETEGVTRRREVVTCRVERVGKAWKIFSFKPLALFAPLGQ
jgi:hypothetical protein